MQHHLLWNDLEQNIAAELFTPKWILAKLDFLELTHPILDQKIQERRV